MTKHILIFLLAFAFLPSVFAQNYEGAELIVGAKGGVSFSTLAFEPLLDNQRQLQGVVAGGLFRYSGEKYLAVQVEANFFQRGWREKNGFKRQFSYLQVPLLTHIFVGHKNFRFFVNLGPEVALFLSENQSGTPSEAAYSAEMVKKRLSYGILGGGGIEIHTKSGIYQLEGRYHFGMGDVFDNNPLTAVFRRSTHRNITVTIGYLFDLNKINEKIE
jgi:hypothetical protein